MKRILIIIVLWIVPVVSTYAATINCNRSPNDIEMAICQDQEILGSDKLLSTLFDQVRVNYRGSLRTSLVRGEQKWLMLRREACMPAALSDRSGLGDCLRSVYKQRIQELQDLSDVQQLYKLRPDLAPPDIEKILDDVSVDIPRVSGNSPMYLMGSNFKTKREAHTCREVFTLTKGLWSYGQDTRGLFSTQLVLSACAIKILSVQKFSDKKASIAGLNFHDISQYWMALPYIGGEDSPLSEYVDEKTKTFSQAADAGKIRIVAGALPIFKEIDSSYLDNFLVIDRDFFYVRDENYRFLQISSPSDYTNQGKVEALVSLAIFGTSGSARVVSVMLGYYDPSTSAIRLKEINSDYRLKLAT